MKKNFLLKLPPRCQPIWTIHIPFKSPHWIQKLLHIFTERNFTMCPCSNATTYSNITPFYVAWQRVKIPSQVLYIWNLWVKGFQKVFTEFCFISNCIRLLNKIFSELLMKLFIVNWFLLISIVSINFYSTHKDIQFYHEIFYKYIQLQPPSMTQ